MAVERQESVSRSEPALEFPRAMGQQDALLWRMERDPRFRSTLVVVALVDRAPERERLRRKLAEAARGLPRLRQRIVALPELVSTPLWVEAEHFDLDYHLRWGRAPGDASLRGVLDLAGGLVHRTFDPERPPWECVVVEGVEEGRAALLLRLHHSMTDGVGGVKLMAGFFDAQRDAAPAEAPRDPEACAAREIGPQRLLVHAVRERLGAAPGHLVQTASWLSSAAGHPLAALRRGRDQLASLRRGMSSGPGPLSPIMQARSTQCRLEAFALPLETLKAAAHAAGCKLNDAFLAGATAGLRLYHERHAAPVAALNAAVPINRRGRRATPEVAGVDMAVARIVLPLDERDPATRMRSLHALVAAERDEPYQEYSELVAGVLYRLPLRLALRAYAAAALKNDFVASSVPGLTIPIYLAGARVDSLLTFGPLSGAALNLTLFSYLDQAAVAIHVDSAAVPDLERLVGCLKEGFEEVLKLSGTAQA